MSPGWVTFQCATLGHYFTITVTVSSGGGDLDIVDVFDSRRLVTVQVYYKGNSWKQSIWVDTITLNRVVSIIGTLKTIKQGIITVLSKINRDIKNIKVTARKGN